MNLKKEIGEKPLVSIIVPMYNATATLKETIESVRAQTYSNWELVLVDDCSTDNTYRFAESFVAMDGRIKLFKMPANGGPGAATKLGFEKSSGNLIAFVDADDLWMPDKTQKQIDFMIEKDCEFICSDYCWVDENGKALNKVIRCKKEADYSTVLRCCPIGSSTVMITRNQLNKITIPTIRKNNDYALWLQILCDGTKIYGMSEVLMKYRIVSTSNSFNKRKMIKYFWEVYREYEHFSIIKSAFLLGQYIFIKALKINK